MPTPVRGLRERERESEEESGKLVSEREVIKGEEKGIRERS